MPRYTPYPADAISSSLAFDEGWGGGVPYPPDSVRRNRKWYVIP